MYSGPGGLPYADLSNRLIMLGLELMESYHSLSISPRRSLARIVETVLSIRILHYGYRLDDHPAVGFHVRLPFSDVVNHHIHNPTEGNFVRTCNWFKAVPVRAFKYPRMRRLSRENG